MRLRAFPAQGRVVVEGLRFQHLLSLKNHGDARRGEDHGGSEQGPLARPDAFGFVGMNHGRHAAALVVHAGDIVMRLGKDDALEAGPIGQGAGDRVHIALRIVGGGQLVVERPAVADIPLGLEVEVVLEAGVLGYAQRARVGASHFRVDLAQHVASLRIEAVIAVEDVVNRVPAEAVQAVFFEEHEDLVADERAHLGASEVGAGRAPGRMDSAVAIEIDAAEVLFVPAVELPEVEVRGAIVVMDDIRQHDHAAVVGGAHESLEGVGPAIVAFHREKVGGIISPAQPAGELVDRHQLNARHAQLAQMVESLDGGIECGRRRAAGKRAHMQLIEHQILARHIGRADRAPVKGRRIIQNGIAVGVFHLPRARIAFPDVVVEDELVHLPLARLGEKKSPGAVRVHGIHVARLPVRELAGHGGRLGEGRPHPEQRAAGSGKRPERGRIGHGQTEG